MATSGKNDERAEATDAEPTRHNGRLFKGLRKIGHAEGYKETELYLSVAQTRSLLFMVLAMFESTAYTSELD